VRDFHQDGEEATLTINEKGNRHRTIGIHFAAAEALAEYLGKAGLESGPIFRARRAPHSDELGDKPMSEASMYRVIAGYVAKLPGAVKEGARLYSTHSLRATTATLLLDAGVDIRKVQELLGHRHITTTQIYDKRRRTTKESASHDVPIKVKVLGLRLRVRLSPGASVFMRCHVLDASCEKGQRLAETAMVLKRLVAGLTATFEVCRRLVSWSCRLGARISRNRRRLTEPLGHGARLRLTCQTTCQTIVS
jgi:DNA-binding transcriptional MerR regulator